MSSNQPAHSRIGASSYKRWSNCHGSVALCSTLPEQETSSYADEGHRAHAAAEHFLKRGEFPPGTSLEMVQHVMTYITSIYEDERAAGDPEYKRFIEVRLDLSEIAPGAFGTADSIEVFPRLKHMKVRDLKYGVGVVVDVIEQGNPNGQLAYYGLGALLRLVKTYQIETVELVVVQPRAHHEDGPIRRVEVQAAWLLNVFADELATNAEKTRDPKAALVPGEWCRFCPAKSICPKLHANALEAAQTDFAVVKTYDPDKLAAALKLLPSLEAFIKGVNELAFTEATKGRPPTGYKLVARKSNRKWVEGVTAEVAAFELGCKASDLLETPSLKSPAQVEKLLEKADRDTLKTLVVRESSGNVLVSADDPRPAVRNNPQDDFKVVETTAVPIPDNHALLD